MRKILITALLFINTFLIAQPGSKFANIDWGKESDEVELSHENSFLFSDESGFYVNKTKWGRFELSRNIVKYDNELKKVSEIDLEEALKKTGYISRSEFKFNDKLYSVQLNQDRNDLGVYVQEIDPHSLAFKGEKKKIFHYGKYRASGILPEFNYHLSEDHRNLVVSSVDRTDQRKAGTIIELTALDESFNIVWKKSTTFEDPKPTYFIKTILVTDNGDVAYFLESITKNEKPKYEIYAIQDQGKTVHKFPVNSQGFTFNDMKLLVGENGALICTALYFNDNTKSVEGIYYLSWGLRDGEVIEKTENLSLDFFPNYLDSENSRKLLGKKYNAVKRDFVEVDSRGNGKCVLIVKEVFVEESANSHGGIDYRYSTGNIKLISLNAKGQIEWKTSVVKNIASDYTYAIVNDMIFILFNDDVNDTEYYKTQITGRRSKWNTNDNIITLVEIDPDGSQIREPFLNRETKGVVVVSILSKQISDDELLLLYEKDDTYKFAKVKFSAE